MGALQDAVVINPRRLYPAGPDALAEWLPEFRDVDLHTELYRTPREAHTEYLNQRQAA